MSHRDSTPASPTLLCIGIIGLGRIGSVAAQRYLDAGYPVVGYDVRSEAVDRLQNQGMRVAQDIADLGRQADVVLILVLNGQQVHEVTSETAGLLNALPSHAVVVCMSTIERTCVEDLAARCEAMGLGFIDCPFTGGPARAANGTLTLIAASASRIVDRVKNPLAILGNMNIVSDQPGVAQNVKQCNQLLVGVTHAATLEVILLARRLELDPDLVCKIVGSGIAGSDYFRLVADSVNAQKPSPGGLGQLCKDLAIVAQSLADENLSAKVAMAACEYFQMASDQNMHDRESAALMEIVERVARLDAF